MKRSAAATLALALTTGFLILLTPFRAAASDKDCSDFATQRAAQIYYINKGGPQSDPDDLDRDNDGIACDSNPCPCYHGSHLPNTPPARRTVHTHIHLAASSLHRIAGEPVRWTTSVDPDRVRAVKLQLHAVDGTWKTIASGHTSRHGRWTVTRSTRETTTGYRAVVATQLTSTRRYTSATSGTKLLQTQTQRATLALPSTKLTGTNVTATVHAAPVRVNRQVLLQRHTSTGAWKTIFTRRENRNGVSTYSWNSGSHAGAWDYRALIRASSGAAAIFSATHNLAVQLPDVAPAKPTALAASPGDGTAHLSWTEPADADVTSYRIFSGTSATSLSLLDTIDPASSYDVTGLTNGTTYYFAVAAVDAADHSSGKTAAVSAIPVDNVAPATPTRLVATPGDGSVTLTWDTVQAGDLAGYRVQYHTAPDGDWTTTDVPVGSELGYPVADLVNSTNYEFKVAAFDDDGNVSLYSAATPATPLAGP